MPTLDAIIAAAFLWGCLSLFLWIMAQLALRWGWVIPVTLMVVTLIFVTAVLVQ